WGLRLRRRRPRAGALFRTQARAYHTPRHFPRIGRGRLLPDCEDRPEPPFPGCESGPSGYFLSARISSTIFLMSASFTCVFGGIGTGPHTPDPPFLTFSVS